MLHSLSSDGQSVRKDRAEGVGNGVHGIEDTEVVICALRPYTSLS